MLNAYEAHALTLCPIEKEKVRISSELDKISQKIYVAALDGKTTITVEISARFSEDQIEEIVEVLNRSRYSTYKFRYNAPFEFQGNCWILRISWW